MHKYTQEQVEQQVSALNPGAAPDWIKAAAKWLLDHLPAILMALFMGLAKPKPGTEEHDGMLMIMACCEAEHPKTLEGPITDPFAEKAFDWAEQFALSNIPNWIKIVRNFAQAKLSALTP